MIGRFECEATSGNGPHVVWLDDQPLVVTNELRFLNHAPEPNALLDELEVFAVRAIAVGEEITIDYGPDW